MTPKLSPPKIIQEDKEYSHSQTQRQDISSNRIPRAATMLLLALLSCSYQSHKNYQIFEKLDQTSQRTTEDIQRIRERLRTAQSRQKSYADRRRSDLEFQVGDRVLLKVSPWKGVIRFRKRGKLGPRYIGPFTVLARIGKVAYRLELPAVLGQIHSTFHVSQLRKCLADETAHIPLDDIQVDESLNYVERPVAVIDRKVKRLRSKEIGIVKVQWQHRRVPSGPGSRRQRCESTIRSCSQTDFGDEILC
ncbi:hypothetical protein OSB04_020299 [Centaurea solstitialis]|uniref:Tf2-1-like SH3-like domain-containing protein n=1 Tax=Centaurea solstitialis TaxID=347529 RepID=A0AA38T5D3_9ASTR|nr:hypothetical protein OSB04_020299 [Centaurea solstitialis]